MELLGEAVKAVADPEALADASVVELVTTAVNVCAEVRVKNMHSNTLVHAWSLEPTHACTVYTLYTHLYRGEDQTPRSER